MRFGRCYELAGHAMMDDHRHDTAELVHGRIQNPGWPGHAAMDHAWIELDECVWEPATDQWLAGDVFGGMFHPDVHARYTFAEMRQRILRDEHWGPWDQSAGRQTHDKTA